MLSTGMVRRVIPGLSGFAVFLACCCVSGPSTAYGQAPAPTERYSVLRPKISSREASKLYATAAAAIRNPAGFGDGKQAVEDYLKKYYMPSITLYDSSSLADLAKNRAGLFKRFIDNTPNATSRKFFVELTHSFAKGVARNNFHPAVRYNAALMLGDLFETAGTATKPAVPYAPATGELLDLVDNKEFDGVAVPESVKLGALIGLDKHTQLGVNIQYTDRVDKSMLAVVNDDQAPADVDRDVFDWMRAKAAKVLANQHKDAATAEVQQVLTKMISDENVDLHERCRVAAIMGRMKYAPNAGVAGEPDVLALGELTLAVMEESAEAAAEYQKELQGGNFMPRPGGFGRGGYGRGGGRGMRGPNAETGPQFERRELMARLIDIARGAKSLSDGLEDVSQNRLKALVEEMAPTVELLGDEEAVGVEVTRAVIALKGRVQSVVNAWGQPAAEPTGDIVEGFGG